MSFFAQLARILRRSRLLRASFGVGVRRLSCIAQLAQASVVRGAVIVCGVLVLVSCARAATAARAQTTFSPEAIGFTVTPPTSYIRVKPGSQTTHTITLENISRRTLLIQPRIVDFSTDGRSGAPILQNFTTFPYLQFQDGRTLEAGFDKVELRPEQKAQLTLLIGVPPTAEEKEWPLTVLFFAENTTVGVPDSNALLQGSLGSNMIVLVSTESELSRRLSIIDADVPHFTDSMRPLTLQPIFKNKHYAATVASGSASLSDWRGTTITRELYPDVILGYSSREIQALSTSAQPDSLPDRTPITFKPPLFFGFYTLSYAITTPDGIPQEVFTQQIIALPFMAFAVIVVMGIIGASYWYLQRRNQT